MMRWAGAVAMTFWLTGVPAIGQEPANAPPPVPASAAEAAPRPQVETPPYDPSGKRDPFRPFTLDLRAAAQAQPREPQTPLQRYDIGQLTVVGVLWEVNPARAMIEDSIGMGYIVTVGTPIGRNNGVVKAIEPRRVIVEERVLDFYGQERTTEVVMEIPTEAGTKQRERERQ
ncbi:MAG TPA: pilus assembly protein PilP [Candidatus Kryptonia bacterium]|nr:pilus assembly protein PilP [Candidatus Kryptonia bacterium]